MDADLFVCLAQIPAIVSSQQSRAAPASPANRPFSIHPPRVMASAPEQAALEAAPTAAAAGAGSEVDTAASVDESPLQLLEKAAANEATKISSDVPTAPTPASAPSVLSDPGPLARLSRDPVQVCFKFLSLHDLATTHRVSSVWRAAHDAERTKRWIFIQRIPRLIKRLAEELLQDDERFHLAAIKVRRNTGTPRTMHSRCESLMWNEMPLTSLSHLVIALSVLCL